MTQELRRMDDERMATLETTVKLWMEETKEYRNITIADRRALCQKVDKILDKFENLPCKERIGNWQILTKRGEDNWFHIKTIWTFLGAILIVVIGEWLIKR